MNVLLDSNVFVHYLKNVEPYSSVVERGIADGEICLSVVSLAEAIVGASFNEARGIERLTPILEIIPVDLAIAKRAAELRRQVLQRRSRILLLDCFIAATAIECGYRLATINRKDFPFRELTFAKF